MKRVFMILFVIGLVLSGGKAFAAAPTVVVAPAQIMQGDPVMVKIENVSLTDIKSIAFEGQRVGAFMYQGVPTALVAIDLRKPAGNYPVTVTLQNDTILTQSITVQAIVKVDEPLGIPAKLGGNTTASQKHIVKELAKEQQFFGHLFTNKHTLWTQPFIYPVPDHFVTDPYGYFRKTGEYTIAHKGTDYRAPLGTPVVAMDRGVVRAVKSSISYGKTIVIDHGQGLMTYYLHLSSFKVKTGQIVQQGQVIGLSGQTGYALGPHLHLTVRVNNISIDPEKFMALFQQ